jgi:MFS family permease
MTAVLEGGLEPLIHHAATDDGLEKAKLGNVLLMSTGFFFLFSSYVTLQSYLSSVLPGDLGFQSLTVVYVFYGLCVVMAPVFCQRFGSTRTMAAGAVTYSLFSGSLIWGEALPILVASAVLGFGAALLWVSQGEHITACSSAHNRGRNAGIFWMGLQGASTAGPLASFLILSRYSEDDKAQANTLMFTVFTACGLVGLALLCLLKPLPSAAANQDADASAVARSRQPHATKAPSFGAQVASSARAVIAACKQRDTALLLLGCHWSGLEVAFSNGEYFKLVGDGKDESVIGLVFIAWGFTDCVGGVSLGSISDRLERRGLPGRKAIVLLGTACFAAALLITRHVRALPGKDLDVVGPRFPPGAPLAGSASWLAFVGAALFGLGDACWNTQLYAVLGGLYPAHGEVAFAVYQFFQQTGAILGFALPLALSLEDSVGPVIVQACVVGLAALSFCAVVVPSATDPSADDASICTSTDDNSSCDSDDDGTQLKAVLD